MRKQSTLVTFMTSRSPSFLRRAAANRLLSEISSVNDPVRTVDVSCRPTAQISNQVGDLFATGKPPNEVFLEEFWRIDHALGNKIFGHVRLNRGRTDRVDSYSKFLHLNCHGTSHGGQRTLCSGIRHQVRITSQRIHGADIDDDRVVRPLACITNLADKGLCQKKRCALVNRYNSIELLYGNFQHG